MKPDGEANSQNEVDLDATQAWSPQSSHALANNATAGDPIRTVSLEEFERGLLELGFLDAAAVREVLERLTGDELTSRSEDLARALVRQGKLTPYQAGALLQGKQRGLQIGPYIVLDKLGSGGMGTVLKARHRNGGPEIALKLLLPSASKHPNLVARFQREAEVMDRIKHPNVVSCRAIDSHGGLYYLVMEYVKGRDFQRIIRSDGPMKVRRAIECIIQAARGLLAAHEHGIVHRDIKPANLLLDTQGTVRVLDLGLARITQGDDSGTTINSESGLTQSGMFIGTADFTSPEQSDDSKRADHRADIYSLGCTLHYLLTARPPYAGETIMQRVVAHHWKPIPSLLEARPDVPPSLDAIFQAMLAKEPESRLQSMAEVIEQLEACRVVLRANSDNLLVIDGGSVVSKEPAPEDSTVDLNPTPKTETNDPFTFLRPEVPGPDVEDLPSQAPANPDAKRTWAKIAVKGLAAATVIVACVVIFRVAPSHTTSTRAVVFSTTPPDTAPSDTSVATTSSAPPSEDSPKPTVVSVQDSSPAMLPPTNQGPLAESKAAKTEAGPTDPTAASKNSPVKVIADMEKLSGPEQVLRDNGLIKNGRRFLLDEATAVAKYLESKSKLEELQKVTMKKAAIEEYDLLSVGCGDNFQRFSAAGLRGVGARSRGRDHTG